jgi:hypothetical protein
MPVKEYTTTVFPYFIKDAYAFFRNLGPIKNSQSAKYFNNQCNIWNEYLQHDTYDDYWKSRNISTHLKQIKIPTLVVGGWFDAENLYGSLITYKAIESGEINNNCKIVMGPWTHGAWASSEWKQYASHDFKSNTSKTFQDSIETSFFNYHLKDKDSFNISEATIFETGSNKWTHYDQWPPKNTKNVSLYLNSNNEISATPGNSINGEEYTSDPAKPVPYTAGIYASRNNDFLAEDQRFAYTRPDVLYYQSSVLENDFTVTGPISANLQLSISGTDADFIIKVIDVLPDNEPNFRNAPKGFQMAGYQRLVRAEVMRGKFRNSLENPEPFEPNKITSVNFTLNDVAHTFKKGHKIMVQIQSSWFPLVDMNPQQYMKIPDADKDDFKKISVKIFHNSKISFPSLQQK